MTSEAIESAPATAQATMPTNASLLERINFERRNIRFSDIVLMRDDWALRDPNELKTYGDTPLTALVEDIKPKGNIHTPIKVKPLPDGKYLLLAGHRRYFALKILIEGNVGGFSNDMEVPADVVVSQNSELALLACVISENVQRTTPEPVGRMFGVRRLHSLGMPIDDIARTYGMSKSTVLRDVAVSNSREMVAHVQDGDITYADAAALISLAIAKNRLAEFLPVLQSELDEIREKLLEEERSRLARDEESLNPLAAKLKDYLPTAQLQAWKDQLKNGQPLGKPVFKYRAWLGKVKGRMRLVVDGIDKPIDEMADEDLAKVLARLEEVKSDGVTVLKERRKQRPESAEPAERTNAGIEFLKAEGLGDLAAKLEPSMTTEVPADIDASADDDSPPAATAAPAEDDEPQLTEAALSQQAAGG
jgi:ParB-like chromosome segregation protein Spo0J